MTQYMLVLESNHSVLAWAHNYVIHICVCVWPFFRAGHYIDIFINVTFISSRI